MWIEIPVMSAIMYTGYGGSVITLGENEDKTAARWLLGQHESQKLSIIYFYIQMIFGCEYINALSIRWKACQSNKQWYDVSGLAEVQIKRITPCFQFSAGFWMRRVSGASGGKT